MSELLYKFICLQNLLSPKLKYFVPMKKVLIVIFLTITLSLSGTTFYVSTTGKDSNPGTITQPFATWDYALNLVVAGDMVYIRGGVYYTSGRQYSGSYFGVRVYNRNGTSKNPIEVLAYPGEIPILDCINITQAGYHSGIVLDDCNYWNIKGLTVRNLKEYQSNGTYNYPVNGWALGNCSNITLELCNVYGCGHGFTLGGSSDYIYYKNCDSYENADYYDAGGLANGFSINIRTGKHIFYEGCRAWANSDDGWDSFGGDGYITITNCWAFENGEWDGQYGNGAGFKTGKSSGATESGVQRTLTNCVAWDNTGFGFDESQDNDGTSIQHNIINCTSYNNSTGFNFSYSGAKTDIIRNVISYSEIVGTLGGNTFDHNSWQNGLSVSDADFVSLNSEQAKGARLSNGDLPVITFLHLVEGSDLIDAGVDVGLPYSGKSPDIGAFEFQTAPIAPIPVYLSSVVEDATPSNLEMTYDLNLDSSSVPPLSAFNVFVNNLNRSVILISISGSKVTLTLASAIKFGDIISVSYTKPVSNSLQSLSVREAESISNKSVTNKCKDPTKPNDPPIVVITYEENYNSGFVYELNASGSYDLNNDPLTYEWIVPVNVSVSSTNNSKIKFLSPIVITTQIIQFQLKVNDGKTIVSKSISFNIIPYKPELDVARIVSTGASSYQSTDYPKNVTDGNLLTQWSSKGDNQWLFLQLAESFKISHLEISFRPGQRYSFYFDIYASKDNLLWEPILISATSCNFSGNMQVFDFPLLKINTIYSYIKLIGHGNSVDNLNTISEFKVFGIRQQSSISGATEERSVIIYPNPAVDFFNISIEEPELDPDIIRLIDFSGKIVFEDSLDQGIKNVQIPKNLKTGIYIVELKLGVLTLYAQKLVLNR
jgi:hypothetical protein